MKTSCPHLLRCLLVVIVLGNGSWVMAQDRNAKTTHQNTPDDCMAYIWWNRVQWDSLWHEVYTYSIQGQLMEATHDVHVFQQGMEPLYNFVYGYDGLGRKTEKIQQLWNGAGYDNSIRESWTYDVNGKDSLNFQYQWVWTPFGYAWDTVNGSRWLYGYTPSGDISYWEQSQWTTTTSGSYWTDYSKTAYHFSPALAWDTVTFYSSISGNWVPHSRWVDVVWHDYAQRQHASYILQNASGGWTNMQRVTCTYTGLDSDCTFEDYSSGAWDSSGREYRTYDAAAHLTKRERWQLQDTTWSIFNGEKHFYTYDSLGRHIEQIDQTWDPVVGYLNANRYVYGSFFVGMADAIPVSLNVKVYPNPVVDRLHFSLETKPGPVAITLHDLQGRLRMQCQTVYTGAEISLPISQTLEQGEYLYQILTKTGRAQGKVIVCH